MILVCAWCPESPDVPPATRVSHGICDSCAARFIAGGCSGKRVQAQGDASTQLVPTYSQVLGFDPVLPGGPRCDDGVTAATAVASHGDLLGAQGPTTVQLADPDRSSRPRRVAGGGYPQTHNDPGSGDSPGPKGNLHGRS